MANEKVKNDCHNNKKKATKHESPFLVAFYHYHVLHREAEKHLDKPWKRHIACFCLFKQREDVPAGLLNANPIVGLHEFICNPQRGLN
jgi:hypothetical protein